MKTCPLKAYRPLTLLLLAKKTVSIIWDGDKAGLIDLPKFLFKMFVRFSLFSL